MNFGTIDFRRIWILILIFSVGIVFGQDPFGNPVTLPDASSDISQAVVFADYDQDGWVDVYISRSNNFDGTSFTNLLYKNNAGTFVLQNIPGITDYLRTTGSASWGDYNNDGFIDLLVATAQNGSGGSLWPNHLFENDGTGGFIDRTNDSGVGDLVTTNEDSRHLGWGDYNNDGFLDTYVDNGNIGTFGPTKGENSFFSNDGDGSYTELFAADIGNIVSTDIDYKTFGSGFGWSDYNNDGYMDIFNCSGGGPNGTYLWKNDAGTGFVAELTDTFQVAQSSFMGVSWGDYDNDGDMDLFITNIVDGSVTHNFLYRNNSSPSTSDFTEIENGDPLITDEFNTQGSAWGDVDNDGDLDIFVSNADENSASTLYENAGSGAYTFSRLKDYYYPEPDGSFKGRGCAFADINNDGHLDLIAAREGAPLLYQNAASSGNGFTNIALVGTGTTNPSAIGSRIFMFADIPEQSGFTTQLREISGQTGGGGQNSLRAHFGLGSAVKIDSFFVEWLNSSSGSTKSVNFYQDLPVNKFMVVIQGEDNVTAQVVPEQNFMYLTGNTGSSVDITSNSDTDGGEITVTRFRQGPANQTIEPQEVTAPGGDPVTPNIVVNDRYWEIVNSGLSNFTYSIYLDITDVAYEADSLVVLTRPGSSDSWQPLNSQRIGNTLYAEGLSSFSEFAIGYEEITSGFDQDLSGVVKEFTLSQNFPNPFNPSTRIHFNLPKAGEVKLSVYDIKGQKISQLIDQSMSAGNHSVSFNAENLPSGVYFYRIRYGTISQIRKMMLVR